MAWAIFGVCVAVCLICLANDNYYSMAPIFGAVVFGFAALAVGVWMLGLHYDRATCHSWAKKTERPTKFAYYNAFAWECLTQAHDGKWVPKEQIGDYNK
jgi:hypothetical protein